MDAMTLWKISWAIGAVVVVIVAVLLILILAAARRIDSRAGEIWQAGKEIASNTVSIWMLQKTNVVASEILTVARGIAGGAGAIDEKLASLARGKDA